jgi:hypothetical protein
MADSRGKSRSLTTIPRDIPVRVLRQPARKLRLPLPAATTFDHETSAPAIAATIFTTWGVKTFTGNNCATSTVGKVAF